MSTTDDNPISDEEIAQMREHLAMCGCLFHTEGKRLLEAYLKLTQRRKRKSKS